MKIFILPLILIAILLSSCSTTNTPKGISEESTTTIYLVRHAEKADDGTSDPALTETGKKRAVLLSEILNDKNINRIYSSDYKRTKQTAFPLSRNTKIAIGTYDPRNLNVIAGQLSALKNQNILVVGHSNSTPSLANLLLEKEEYTQFDESDYNNLIVITIKNGIRTSGNLSFTLP